MATSPTVLATEPASTASTSAAAPAAPAPAGFPMGRLLGAVFAGIVVAALLVGGGVYWLVRSGRLPIQGAAPAKQALAAPAPTHVVTLDPLVVNLADADGTAYLRVTMALRVEDAVGEKSEKASGEKAGDAANSSIVQARDTALTVLGQQTAAALLEAGGKEVLKEELKVAFAKDDPSLKVADIYFTDFLVQR